MGKKLLIGMEIWPGADPMPIIQRDAILNPLPRDVGSYDQRERR